MKKWPEVVGTTKSATVQTQAHLALQPRRMHGERACEGRLPDAGDDRRDGQFRFNRIQTPSEVFSVSTMDRGRYYYGTEAPLARFPMRPPPIPFPYGTPNRASVDGRNHRELVWVDRDTRPSHGWADCPQAVRPDRRTPGSRSRSRSPRGIRRDSRTRIDRRRRERPNLLVLGGRLGTRAVVPQMQAPRNGPPSRSPLQQMGARPSSTAPDPSTAPGSTSEAKGKFRDLSPQSRQRLRRRFQRKRWRQRRKQREREAKEQKQATNDRQDPRNLSAKDTLPDKPAGSSIATSVARSPIATAADKESTRIVPVAIVEPIARDVYEVPVASRSNHGHGSNRSYGQGAEGEGPASAEEDVEQLREEAETVEEDFDDLEVLRFERFLAAGERGEIQPLAREEIVQLLDDADEGDPFSVNHGIVLEDE